MALLISYTLLYRMVTVDVPCFVMGVLLLSVNVFLSALMYTAVALYHGDDYPEMVFRMVLDIIAELVIKNVMRVEVYEYLWLFTMLRG